jgi:YHS domain-containing protein
MTRLTLTVALICGAALAEAPKKSDREALKPLHGLIGDWKATGTPNGSREEREKGHWFESAAWQWQFKGASAWLRADLEKGKHFTRFEIRPAGDGYELKAWPAGGGEPRRLLGKLEKNRLIFERQEGKTAEQVTFVLLHSNRYSYALAVRPEGHAVFSEKYKVWGTKQGVPFAVVDKGPECIVSGGKGTSTVSYKGKTYYVCCSGCRDAFNAEPAKYVKEYEDSLKKK